MIYRMDETAEDVAAAAGVSRIWICIRHVCCSRFLTRPIDTMIWVTWRRHDCYDKWLSFDFWRVRFVGFLRNSLSLTIQDDAEFCAFFCFTCILSFCCFAFALVFLFLVLVGLFLYALFYVPRPSSSLLVVAHSESFFPTSSYQPFFSLLTPFSTDREIFSLFSCTAPHNRIFAPHQGKVGCMFFLLRFSSPHSSRVNVNVRKQRRVTHVFHEFFSFSFFTST